MKIVESPLEAYAQVQHWRSEGLQIGFVPTMGALHEGHYSLVRTSKSQTDRTAVSIFVNPAQFAANEDLGRYPRTLEADLAGLRDLGVDLVFTPQQASLYPPNFSTYIDPPAVAEPLEGECRPGHFRGVTTIVLKLFQIVPATVAFFGQKDFQQLLVIRELVRDLDVPIRIEGCPIVREEDGLAMSSRNRYLSAEERQRALSLWRSLVRARDMLAVGIANVGELEDAMVTELKDSTDVIDYARIVDPQTLQTMQTIEKTAVALVAARVGETRLIDNLLLSRTSKTA